MHTSGSECATETRTRAGHRGVLSRRHAASQQRIDDRWKNAGDATALVVVVVAAAAVRATAPRVRDRARGVATDDERRRRGLLKQLSLTVGVPWPRAG